MSKKTHALTVVLSIAAAAAIAQSPCVQVPVVSATAHPNIFSLQQEQWLGDATRDYIEGHVVPVKDPALSAHLQAIVDRMAANLPDAHVPFHVLLVESSDVNGISIGGGTIYITRKLAATAKSDDELAGVLSHEMGHIASHQFAFEFTADLQRLLHVDHLGDRADVYARFQQLIDARMDDKHPPKVKDDDAQDEADRVGIYLAAAAGYRVSAEPEFFDRAFYIEGKTGSRLGDFFGFTKPGQKRLRGMKQLIATLPPACASQSSTPQMQTAFEVWRNQVIANRAGTAEAAGTGAVAKLSPPLQMELRRIRFSPDGKLLLAQDESSIYVLDRVLMKLRFRMDADGAYPAWFSPDSASVSFLTPGLHSETWSVTQGKMMSVHESVFAHDCLEGKISPDGRSIICVWRKDTDESFSLSLIDVDTDRVVLEKSKFLDLPYWFLEQVRWAFGHDDTESLIWNTFSPDGNFFFLGIDEGKVAIDLRSRTEVSIGGSLRHGMTGPFAFIGNDKMAATNVHDVGSSGVFSFPDGKRIAKLHVPLQDMSAVTDPGDKWLVLTDALRRTANSPSSTPAPKSDSKTPPPPEERVAVADLNTGTVVLATKATSLDMWRSSIVTEMSGGGILTGDLENAKIVNAKHLQLPPSPLGRLQSVSLSKDGKFLSYATRDRGAVWDLSSGKQTFLTSTYRNSVWTAENKFYADFKVFPKGDRIVRQFDPALRQETPLATLLEGKDSFLRFGRVFRVDKDPKGKNDTLIITGLPDGKELWRKSLKRGGPWMTSSYGWKDIIFSSLTDSDYAKSVFSANPALKSMLAEIKDKNRARLIEIVDSNTGASIHQAVLAMPRDYTGVGGANRIGDILLVTGENNRTLALSLTTGKQLWQVFGVVESIDPAHNRACMLNRQDEAIVYDMDAKEITRVRAGHTIRFAQLADDGKRLILLLADQTVQLVDLPQPTAATSIAQR